MDLGGRQLGKQQLVVLAAGGAQNAGHVHTPAVDVDRLADGQVQQAGGLGTGQHGIAVGPVAGQAPPGLEDVDAVHVDAG